MSRHRRSKLRFAGALALACCTAASADVAIELRDYCPPGFELTNGNRCELHTLYDNYDSLRDAGVGAGCHAYSAKMIGPPTQIIQALYMDNPQGIVDYITNPVKKRDDYPEMPPQNYLSEEVRMAAAQYMLEVTN
jgi:hypothetical protein